MTRMANRCFLLAALAAPLARSSGAQTSAEINAGIQFNLSNPGARSLALGGAFIGLADDATAAYTNPAGLTNLSKPEVSIEGRYFRYTNRFLNNGHAEGQPTNPPCLFPGQTTPVTPCTDTISGSVFKESTDTTTNLSFVSFVYPRSRWAVAIYRHELANFKASQRTEGAFFDVTYTDSGAQKTVPARFNPTQGEIDIKIVNYGVGFAIRIAEGFSLGAGISLFDFDESSVVTRFGLGSTLQEFYGAPNYSPANIAAIENADGDDRDVAFNGGLLWKPSRYVAVGAVYRQGPKFDLAAAFSDRTNASVTSHSAVFHVPDVYGVGVAVHPAELLTITLDYDHVKFSQFGDNTLNVRGEGVRYTADDANQFRAGLQYVFPIGSSFLAIRGGYWRDPDHRVRAVGVQPSPQDNFTTARNKAINRLLFVSGSDVDHYTGGIGLAAGEHFQLDGAVDYAKTVTTVSLSAVGRF